MKILNGSPSRFSRLLTLSVATFSLSLALGSMLSGCDQKSEGNKQPPGSCALTRASDGTPTSYGWPSVNGVLDCTADASVCMSGDPCQDTLACKSAGTPDPQTAYKCEPFKAKGEACQWNLQCGNLACIDGACGGSTGSNPDMGTTTQTCDAPGKVRTTDSAVCAPMIGADPSKLEWVTGDFVRTYQTGGGRCTFIEARNSGGAESTVANPANAGTVYSVALTPSTTSVIAYNCQGAPTIFAVGRRGTRVVNSKAVGTDATAGATTSL